MTQLFREVSAELFTEQKNWCVHALANSLSDILEIRPVEGFKLQSDPVDYFNQIFDFKSLNERPYVPIPESVFADAAMSTSAEVSAAGRVHIRRRLGQNHGSIGSTLSYTLYIRPAALGFASNDEAYFSTRNDLLESLDRGVFVDVLRVKATAVGCDALARVEGSSATFISSDYLSTVTHSSRPTSMPSQVPRVRRAYNFAGIMAGTIVGITAFIVLGMVLLQYKYALGFDKSPERLADEPTIEI